MCDHCEWAAFVADADAVLAMLGQLINQGPVAIRQQVRESHAFVKKLKAWAETSGHVTPKMVAALDRNRVSAQLRMRTTIGQ